MEFIFFDLSVISIMTYNMFEASVALSVHHNWIMHYSAIRSICILHHFLLQVLVVWSWLSLEIGSLGAKHVAMVVMLHISHSGLGKLINREILLFNTRFWGQL